MRRFISATVLLALSSIYSASTGAAQVAANDNRQPALPSSRAWRAAAQPIFVAGSGEGTDTVTYFRVRGVASLTSGRIVVGNAAGNELVYLDRDGSFLFRVGRRGQGPGEFADVSAIGRVGDSLWAMDHHQGAISVFDDMGQLRRTVPVRRLVLARGMEPRGALEDGRFVLTSNALMLGAPLARPDSTDVILLDPSLDRAETVARIPKNDLGNPVGSKIFGPPTVTVASRDRIYWGSGSRFEIFVLASDGSVMTRIVKPGAQRELTSDMWRRYVERRLAAIRSTSPDAASLRRTVRSQLEASERPRTLPAFDDMLVDPSGNLWVREYAMGRVAPARWHVFDSQGRWLTPVDLPDAFDLHEVNAAGLLGVLRDADDVERVALLRLVKP